MENNLTAEERMMRQAEKLVKAKRGFRTHLIVYICVNIGLAVMYYLTGDGVISFNVNSNSHFWPITLGWGIGLAAHGISVFGKLHGKTLEEEIQAEYKRIKNRVESGDTKA